MAKKKDNEEKQAGGSKKKMILIGAIAGVLLLGGGGAFMMTRGGADETTAADEAERTEGEEIAADASGGGDHGGGGGEAEGESGEGGEKSAVPETTFIFGEMFQVNLIDASKRRFLQVELQFETRSPAVVAELERQLGPVRDTIIMLLSSKRTEEMQMTEGKLKLKQEIIQRVEGILEPGAIQAVNFTSFMILTV